LLNCVIEEIEVGFDPLSQIPEEVIEVPAFDESTEEAGMKLRSKKRGDVIVGDSKHIYPVD